MMYIAIFIIGCFIGGIFGFFAAALINIGKDDVQ